MKYTGKKNSDGRPHGQGTDTDADGNTYKGEWKDGEHNGQGTMKCADGTTYKGEWKGGKVNGQGTATYTNGTYTGEGRGRMGKPLQLCFQTQSVLCKDL